MSRNFFTAMIRYILSWGKNHKTSLDSGVKQPLRLPLISRLIYIGFCLSLPHLSLTGVSAAQDSFLDYGSFQSNSGQSEFYGIRSALIMAAAEEEGLTLLNGSDQKKWHRSNPVEIRY